LTKEPVPPETCPNLRAMNTPIPNHPSGIALWSRRFLSTTAAGLLAAVVAAGALPSLAHAQPPFRDGRDGWGDRGPHRDVQVLIEPGRAGPRFVYGPGRDEFLFVRGVPEGRFINSRESLLDLLLHPAVDAVAWGLGDIASVEVANLLGLPVHTTLYAVEPGVSVVSTLPPGYFVAQTVPENVALVSSGPAGAVVVVRHVPPGAFVAYQTSPNGVVLNECVVVPPVQQVVVPAVATPAPAVVMTSPAPAVVTAPAPTAAPAPAAPAVPMSNKMGKIVYGADGKPAGVIVLDADGKQEYVPIQ